MVEGAPANYVSKSEKLLHYTRHRDAIKSKKSWQYTEESVSPDPLFQVREMFIRTRITDNNQVPWMKSRP